MTIAPFAASLMRRSTMNVAGTTTISAEAHRRRLLQNTAAFADDQLIAGPHLALDNFCVGIVVETESDQHSCRLSVAQDPELRPAIRQHPWTAGVRAF